jgi:hypothetical protein
LQCAGFRNSYSLVLRRSIYEFLSENFPIAIFRSLINDNLFVLIIQLVDDELDLLVELELVEFCDTVCADNGTVEELELAYAWSMVSARKWCRASRCGSSHFKILDGCWRGGGTDPD